MKDSGKTQNAYQFVFLLSKCTRDDFRSRAKSLKGVLQEDIFDYPARQSVSNINQPLRSPPKNTWIRVRTHRTRWNGIRRELMFTSNRLELKKPGSLLTTGFLRIYFIHQGENNNNPNRVVSSSDSAVQVLPQLSNQIKRNFQHADDFPALNSEIQCQFWILIGRKPRRGAEWLAYLSRNICRCFNFATGLNLFPLPFVAWAASIRLISSSLLFKGPRVRIRMGTTSTALSQCLWQHKIHDKCTRNCSGTHNDSFQMLTHITPLI